MGATVEITFSENLKCRSEFDHPEKYNTSNRLTMKSTGTLCLEKIPRVNDISHQNKCHQNCINFIFLIMMRTENYALHSLDSGYYYPSLKK